MTLDVLIGLKGEDRGIGLRLGMATGFHSDEHPGVDTLSGIDIALLAGGKKVTGLQIGLLTAPFYMSGAQLGVINVSDFSLKGVQLGLANVAGSGNEPNVSSKGCQIGLSNSSDEFDGVQVGLFNRVSQQLKKFQIGIVCYAESGRGAQVGLVTIRGTDSGPWYSRISPFFGYLAGPSLPALSQP